MRFAATLLLCAALAFAGCGEGSSSTDVPTSSPEAVKRGEPEVSVPEGAPPKQLVVRDLIEGSGDPAKDGDRLTVEYVGVDYRGKQVANSWDNRKPFDLELGGGVYFVNPGWERGLRGMRLGGRRELIVPPRLQDIEGAKPGSTPADTLVWVIDLVILK